MIPGTWSHALMVAIIAQVAIVVGITIIVRKFRALQSKRKPMAIRKRQLIRVNAKPVADERDSQAAFRRIHNEQRARLGF